jgi:hypothetical protein
MSKLKAEIAKYQLNSRCHIVFFVDKDRSLTRMRMDFRGPVANIPSLKNAKLPGKNFLAPSVIARLKVMDACFATALEMSGFKGLLSFGKKDVALVLVCGKRRVAFDTDNCLATVRDWLEPRTKKVGKAKQRGWGIGLVENDRQIRGLAVYDKDLGIRLEKSVLVVQQFDTGKQSLAQVIDGVFKEIVEEAASCQAN